MLDTILLSEGKVSGHAVRVLWGPATFCQTFFLSRTCRGIPRGSLAGGSKKLNKTQKTHVFLEGKARSAEEYITLVNGFWVLCTIYVKQYRSQ